MNMKKINKHLSIKIFTVFSLAFILHTLPVNAQSYSVVHDDQKEKQWLSMEVGPWDFAPDWYYYFLHQKYSGAEAYWQWQGFKSGMRVRFKEDKSNVKRVNPTRIISEETQREKVKKVEEQKKYIEELYKEDLVKQADRLIDSAYPLYKDDFNRMQEIISEGLLYCMYKSKGKVQNQISEISRRNEVVCANIAYIRETGLGYELENSKRQRAYEEAKEEMKELVDKTVLLAAFVEYVY